MGAADSYQPFLWALCLWREARGQSDDAKRAVLHVILNRAKAGFRGSDPASVILWPYQFSSFNPKDRTQRGFLPGQTWLIGGPGWLALL